MPYSATHTNNRTRNPSAKGSRRVPKETSQLPPEAAALESVFPYTSQPNPPKSALEQKVCALESQFLSLQEFMRASVQYQANTMEQMHLRTVEYCNQISSFVVRALVPLQPVPTGVPVAHTSASAPQTPSQPPLIVSPLKLVKLQRGPDLLGLYVADFADLQRKIKQQWKLDSARYRLEYVVLDPTFPSE